MANQVVKNPKNHQSGDIYDGDFSGQKLMFQTFHGIDFVMLSNADKLWFLSLGFKDDEITTKMYHV